MDPERFKKVCELFAKVRELPEAERARILGEFSEDAELLEEMSGLIDAYAHPLNLEPIRDAQDSGHTATLSDDNGAQPTAAPHLIHIDGYDILRRLDEGGQGAVYQALQRSTRRKVAVKILREGVMASQSAKKRFEREIELVAQLRHPNIISVIDSGCTTEGHPYFAMDYVRGLRVDEYIREKKPTLEDALKLFCIVCEAIQYAHQRAIIHRDLKPSNILVDTDGSPRVLDFGLAKWIGGASGTLISISQNIMGTLPYMSPELTRGNPDEIDTRTDVYALGVILFEMLTGHYPYPVTGDIAEVILHITHTPPSSPSRCWTPESGITRRTARIVRASQCPIDDELQTIVLRSLAKEPERRYQSAGEFARDINRYMSGEAIEAKRDSKLYVLRKTLAAYKRGVAIAILGVALLTTGAFSATNWITSHNQEIASNHLNRAIRLISTREDLADARAHLTAASHSAPDDPKTHLWLGFLTAFEGLQKPTESKPHALAAARDELMIADTKARDGSQDPTSLATSSAALRFAAKLLLLENPDSDMANEFLDRAASIPSDSPALLPLYDSNHDSLFEDLPNGNSPDIENLAVDRDATIHRYLPALVTSLNPMHAKTVNTYVINLIFDPLFIVNDSLQCVQNPAMVDNIDQGENVTMVHLKEGLTWHDNEPLTAADIEFSWNTIPSGHFEHEQDVVSDVEAIGPLTVAFHHDPGTTYWELRVPIVPQHRFEELISNNECTSPDDCHAMFGKDFFDLVGNGPYTVHDDSSLTTMIKLQRWADYFGDKPHIKTVVFDIANHKHDERVSLLEHGELDATELTSEQFRWHVNGDSFEPHIRKYNINRHSYAYICWNIDNPLFSSRTVRRALAMAMDLGQISGHWHGHLYPQCFGIDSRLTTLDDTQQVSYRLDHDRDTARTLLEKEGWIRVDDEFRSAGDSFAFTLLVHNGSTETLRIMKDLKSQLGAFGITMKISEVSWSTLTARRESGEFDAYVSAVVNSPNLADIQQRWRSDAEYNYGHYSNEEVDDLFDRARTASDDERPAIYRTINEIIYGDQPYAFLWTRPRLWALNKELRGVKVTSMGILGFHPGPRAWWLPIVSSIDPQ